MTRKKQPKSELQRVALWTTYFACLLAVARLATEGWYGMWEALLTIGAVAALMTIHAYWIAPRTQPARLTESAHVPYQVASPVHAQVADQVYGQVADQVYAQAAAPVGAIRR